MMIMQMQTNLIFTYIISLFFQNPSAPRRLQTREDRIHYGREQQWVTDYHLID